jgi:hypothetical protein
VTLGGWAGRRALPALLFAGLGIAAMLPELIWGTSFSYSILYNVNWGEQFPALMREGTLYPRWLPQSWDGLGSPTFYFYSPLFYIVAGVFHTLSGGMLGGASAMALASAFFLCISGLTMRFWLVTFAAPRVATLGGVAYLLAPYHLHDIYNRGSLAEATTYAALPLILLALKRISDGRSIYVSLLAGSYGVLIFGHLPEALLATVTLIPAYTLWLAIGRDGINWRFLLQALCGGLLGLCLSSVFLLPAIGLMPYALIEQLSSPYFSPESWFFFWGPNSLFSGGLLDFVILTMALSLAYLLLAAAAWWCNRGNREILFWSGLGLLCFLMVSGLMPFVWQLPGLHQVQFPSRMLPIMEVSTITVLALAYRNMRMGIAVPGQIALLIGSIICVMMITDRMKEIATHGAKYRREILADYRDAPEYLPKGFAVAIDAFDRADPAHTKLPDVPIISKSKPDVIIKSVSLLSDSGLEVQLEAPSDAKIIARRFYFPNWKVIELGTGQTVAVEPNAQQLVSWIAPAGEHRYRLMIGAAPFERLGWMLSGLALALILGWAGTARWLTRR